MNGLNEFASIKHEELVAVASGVEANPKGFASSWCHVAVGFLMNEGLGAENT